MQQRVAGRVRVHAPADEIAARMGNWALAVQPDGPLRCLLTLAGRSVDDLAFWLGAMDCDFEVVESAELAEAVGRLADRYARAARSRA
jgi:hypothetical protein